MEIGPFVEVRRRPKARGNDHSTQEADYPYYAQPVVAQIYATDCVGKHSPSRPSLEQPNFLEAMATQHTAWPSVLGDIWSVPTDGRLQLPFQQRELSKLKSDHYPRGHELEGTTCLPIDIIRLVTDAGWRIHIDICDFVNGSVHFYAQGEAKTVEPEPTGSPVPLVLSHDDESLKCTPAPWHRIV